MPTTLIQPLPYPPAVGVTANVPRDVKALAEAVESRLVMRFASTAARDAAIPSGQRVAGMLAWVDADQTRYVWSTAGTASWRPEWSPGTAVSVAMAAGQTGTAQYQLIGPLVVVTWSSTTSIASPGAALPVFTLPDVARPGGDTPATISNTSLYPMTGRVTTGGDVQVRNNHTAAIGSHQGIAVYPRKVV